MVLEASRNDEYEGNFILEMLGFESSRDSSGRDNRSEARMAKGNLPLLRQGYGGQARSSAEEENCPLQGAVPVGTRRASLPTAAFRNEVDLTRAERIPRIGHLIGDSGGGFYSFV